MGRSSRDMRLDPLMLRPFDPQSAAGAANLCRRPLQMLAEFLAGLEVRECLLSHWDGYTTPRIAGDPRSSALYREATEASYLNAVATRQRSNDHLEHRVDDLFQIALIQMWVLLG